MEEAFWLSSEHQGSLRSAIVADEGESLWLYLTEPGGGEIAADCWLFNRVPSPTRDELKARRAEYAAAGQPPPAAADVVDEGALLVGALDASRVAIEWAPDGEAVAVSVDGALAGVITSAERRGYSAHLRDACPWGRPLSRELRARLLGSPEPES